MFHMLYNLDVMLIIPSPTVTIRLSYSVLAANRQSCCISATMLYIPKLEIRLSWTMFATIWPSCYVSRAMWLSFFQYPVQSATRLSCFISTISRASWPTGTCHVITTRNPLCALNFKNSKMLSSLQFIHESRLFLNKCDTRDNGRNT